MFLLVVFIHSTACEESSDTRLPQSRSIIPMSRRGRRQISKYTNNCSVVSKNAGCCYFSTTELSEFVEQIMLFFLLCLKIFNPAYLSI